MSNVRFPALLVAFIIFASNLFQPALSATKYAHEREWLVDFIGRDVAEMTLYAAKKTGAPVALDAIDYKTVESEGDETSYTYELKLDGATEKKSLVLSDYFWNPGNFAPIATYLMSKYKLKPSSSSTATNPEFIRDLAKVDSQVFARENKRLSDELTNDPLNPNLHEQAALLCSGFAMREWCNGFNDLRSAVNRITAHLAMASALRPNSEPSLSGKLAELTLLCLIGRTADCLAQSAQVQTTCKDVAALSWLRALRYRATSDFRTVLPADACQIERIEYGRTLAVGRGADAFMQFLDSDKNNVESIDWQRTGEFAQPTVAAGHRFSEQAVTAEMADFMSDYKLYHENSSRPDPISEMNKQPVRCLILEQPARLEPLNWNTVAVFHTRHILDGVVNKHFFEAKSWNVPEQARATVTETDALFSKVDLYPLCKIEMVAHLDNGGITKGDSALTDSLATVIDKYPELVTTKIWLCSHQRASSPEKVPPAEPWFIPLIPMGTVFAIGDRAFDAKPFSLLDLEQLRKLDPYSYSPPSLILYGQYGNAAPGDRLVELYGPLAEYNLRLIKRIVDAYESEPEKQIKYLEKAEKFDNGLTFRLAKAYGEQGQTAKAVATFERAMGKDPGSIQSAYYSWYLVDYYLNQKQTDKALALAKEAAACYSSHGLLTLASAYERLGKLREAEEWFKNDHERYGHPAYLAGFYLRHEKADPRYKVEIDNLTKANFPKGLIKLQPSDLVKPPSAGAVISESSDKTKKFGLKDGDVFVGVDGFKVESQTQYSFLRETDWLYSPFELTVWNGSAYRTFKASSKDRKFGCIVSDLNAPKP